MITNHLRSIASLKKQANKKTVLLSNDKIRLVIEENKSASDTKMLDFKKAEEEIDNLKGMLLDDTHTASEIHQLGNKRVLFLSLDKS